MTEVRWLVVNRSQQPFTFSTLQGRSNIDITVANAAIFHRISSWTVHPSLTSSAHRLISFRVGAPSHRELLTLPTFNTSRARWDVFLVAVEDALRSVHLDQRSPPAVEDLARLLHHAILTGASVAIPLKKYFPRSVPWWTPQLTRAKRFYQRSRRRLQRAPTEARRLILLGRYKSARRFYTRLVARSKLTSWRSFITDRDNASAFGFVYRLLRGKISPAVALLAMDRPASTSSTWSSAADFLLSSLFPPDVTAYGSLATYVSSLPFQTDVSTRHWTEDEVLSSLEAYPPRKAPGPDRIESAMLHYLLDALLFVSVLTSLYNSCLSYSHFPSIWKIALVRALLKSPDRDSCLSSSYRPICLLPALSKTFERLIKRRLSPILSHPQFTSPWQFGFRRGFSAEDALYHVCEQVRLSPHRHVIGILFDASAAFDHLWWPSIFLELSLRNCPSDLVALLVSYFSERTVSLQGHYSRSTYRLTKGCPQGSVLGPDMWSLVMSSLLRSLDALGAIYAAYADDLFVLVSGDSRRLVEIRAQLLTNLVSTWALNNHLQLSTSKTIVGELKGNFRNRPPTIKLNDVSLHFSPTFKYLGVTFGARMAVSPHLRALRTRSSQVMTALTRKSHTSWGLKFPILRTYYYSIFLPMVSYGPGAWARFLTSSHEALLSALHRSALL